MREHGTFKLLPSSFCNGLLLRAHFWSTLEGNYFSCISLTSIGLKTFCATATATLNFFLLCENGLPSRYGGQTRSPRIIHI